MTKPTVFISYSHKDEYWKERLLTQLGVLQQENILDIWDDRRIGCGEDWYPKIQESIKAANVVILLVTADFLTSKFIRSEEVPLLLERREKEGLHIFPVIIKPCPWKQVKWLAQMNLRPKDGRPISGGNDYQIDSDMASIAEEVASIILRRQTLITAEPEKSVEDEVEKELIKLILEHGAAATKKKTLAIGENWDIGGGWALTAQDVDAKVTPRRAWLVLSKGGVKREDKIVTEGKIYTYVESIVSETGIFLFATYVDVVFAGSTANLVLLISAEPIKSKEYGVDKKLTKLIFEHATTTKPQKLGEEKVEREIIRLIFEHGSAAANKKTLAVGENWDIGDGWALTVESIDAMTSPRQAWFVLSKDGIKKEDIIVAEGKICTYIEKSIGVETIAPLFVAFVDAVFAGATMDLVVLITVEPTKIKDEKIKKKLTNLMYEYGTTDIEKRTFDVGETWDLGGGWALTVQSIDVKAVPRQAWLVLNKDGIKKEDIIVAAGKTYKYVEGIAGKADVPLFVAFVNAVFAGATKDSVQFSIEKKKS